MKDVIVIGGGPSGAHFAYEASKNGYSVVLVDSKLLGRHKCCAGGLSGRFLEAYNVPDRLIERKITGLVLISPVGERAELDFEKTVSVTINRATFDKWLVESAIDNGAEAVLGSGVKILFFNKDAVEVQRTDGQTYRSKLLIGAFGMAPEMFRILKIQMPKFVMGTQAELSMPKDQIDGSIGNNSEFYFDSKYSNYGYSYVFPKKQYISIGLVTLPLEKQKRELLWNFIEDYFVTKNIRNFTARSFEEIEFNSAMIPNKPLKITYGNRYILLGDAAGLVDPTTWEGMFFAFKSAELAVETLDENFDKSDFSFEALSIYHAKWKRLFGKDLAYAKKIQGKVYGEKMGKLWTVIISELNENKPFRNAVMEQLARDMSVSKMIKRMSLENKLRLFYRRLR